MRALDANKFGAAYLAKFGWDPSGGLGVSGEGRTKALSVHQKRDMLGIGADHKNSAEGLAWKQNKDFENLLRRLNATTGDEDEAPMKIDGFTKGASMTTVEVRSSSTTLGESVEEGVSEEKRSKKKRKKDAHGDEGEQKKKRKKSKPSEDPSDSDNGSKKTKKKHYPTQGVLK